MCYHINFLCVAYPGFKVFCVPAALPRFHLCFHLHHPLVFSPALYLTPPPTPPLSICVSLFRCNSFSCFLSLFASAFELCLFSLSPPVSLFQVAGWVVTAHQCWVEQGPTAPKAGTEIMQQHHTHARTLAQGHAVVYIPVIRALSPVFICAQDVWSCTIVFRINLRDRWRVDVLFYG